MNLAEPFKARTNLCSENSVASGPEKKSIVRAGGAEKAIALGGAPASRRLLCRLDGGAPRSSLLVGNTMGGLDAEGAADYLNKRDIVLSPRRGFAFLAFQSWGCALLRSASPQAIAPIAPPAQNKSIYSQDRQRRMRSSVAGAIHRLWFILCRP
jgi:hypothetical protein